MATELTTENFDETIKDGVTLVDFWAAWCPPCRVQGPIVEELAKETKNAKVTKLNVDEHHEISDRFGIRSIPTIKIFKDGQEVEEVIGLRPKEALAALIAKHV